MCVRGRERGKEGRKDELKWNEPTHARTHTRLVSASGLSLFGFQRDRPSADASTHPSRETSWSRAKPRRANISTEGQGKAECMDLVRSRELACIASSSCKKVVYCIELGGGGRYRHRKGKGGREGRKSAANDTTTLFYSARKPCQVLLARRHLYLTIFTGRSCSASSSHKSIHPSLDIDRSGIPPLLALDHVPLLGQLLWRGPHIRVFTHAQVYKRAQVLRKGHPRGLGAGARRRGGGSRGRGCAGRLKGRGSGGGACGQPWRRLIDDAL